MVNKLIALDCDQVLLDYTAAYGKMWESCFGEKLTLKNPDAFHAFNAYGVPFESDAQKEHFYAHCYAEEFWNDMPLLEGALEGCEKLVSLGCELVCVTSMKPFLLDARKENLKKVGLPISECYAVGRDRDRPTYNPKYDILMELKPAAFVDDYAINFEGLFRIHRALLHRNQEDSPNWQLMKHVDTTHKYLNEFADFWEHKMNGKTYHWLTRDMPHTICGSTLDENGFVTPWQKMR